MSILEEVIALHVNFFRCEGEQQTMRIEQIGFVWILEGAPRGAKTMSRLHHFYQIASEEQRRWEAIQQEITQV